MKERKLFILDVGHGNCTVLRDDDGDVVIDAGPGGALLEFLRTEGIKRLDVVLLSHADKDHIEGLNALLNSGAFEVGIVSFNPDSTKGAKKGTKLFKDLTASLKDFQKKNKLKIKPSLTDGDSETFNQGKVKIQILAPNALIALRGVGGVDLRGRTLTANSNSAVIRLVVNDHPVALIPGDINSIGFDSLLDDGYDCHADVVIFPHHGGLPGGGNLTSFVKTFCQKTNPKIVVFSIGRETLHNPNPNLVRVVRQVVPNARIICTQLSKHCASELKVKTHDHLTGRFAVGRKQNRCCGGTIEIDLNNLKKSLEPHLDSHRKFIQIAASTPLCGI